ncbi:MAG: YitT family protein [Solobacterium sp.]|nr:YitT family protein [Solobacterium sp.]
MRRALNVLLTVIGTFILTVSVEYFIIPHNILTGGVAGIAVALEPFFHLDKTLVANIIELGLFGLGAMFLGKRFAAQTLIASLCYPLFTTWLARHPYVINIDPILVSFYSGLISGIGVGLVMRTGASTGGMDIPPLIVNKYTGLKLASLVMITDGLTVLLGMMAYGLEAVLLGMVSVFATGLAIDRMLQLGQNSSKSVQVISDKPEELLEGITKKINRGATLMDIEGGYSRHPRKMILCVVSSREYNALLDLIKQIDDRAFVITTNTSDMHGEGFTYRV